MSARCKECSASIPAPAPDAMTMRCPYCGLEQAVPDADARHRRILENQQLELEKRRLAREQEREDRKDEEERREKKRERRWRPLMWLGGLIPFLIAPVIIAITVFDAPARLGFGASGKDRLELIQTQLASTGCKVVKAIASEYATANVSQLVPVTAHQCIRVFAAGGSGHTSLGLKLFGADSGELGHAKSTQDPQLSYCSPTAQSLRYQIEIGIVAKGRLSHMVLACPAPPTPPTPPTPPAKRK